MISSPNVTPFPLGRKQPKKVQEKKEHNIKCYYKEQVYPDRKRYHIQYDRHTNNATSLYFFGIKEKEQHIVNQVLRKQKTMTIFVHGTGIWNLRDPKIQKAR